MLGDDYSVSLLCDLLGCRRSSYYYQPQPKDETEVKSAIQHVVAEWPTSGYRRVTKQLHRQGWDVNKKRVRRLMHAMGLLYHLNKPGESPGKTQQVADLPF
jgi:predicted oxidoreductase (fatty acid repression mutant protein)